MWIPGKFNFPGNVNSRKIWLPGDLNSQKCDFPGNATTWEILLARERMSVKVASQTKWITGNSDFLGKCEKNGIIQIFGHLDMNKWHMWQVWPRVWVASVTTGDKCDHMWHVWPCVTRHSTNTDHISNLAAGPLDEYHLVLSHGWRSTNERMKWCREASEGREVSNVKNFGADKKYVTVWDA